MMRLPDIGRFVLRALTTARLRTALMLLAMAIGVASVVVLTSLGEGARLYVTGQFAALGSNLLIVLPGRSETTGGPPPLLGETPRDLTLEDAGALGRHHAVRYVAPLVVGSAAVSHGQREREVAVLGSTASLFAIRNLQMDRGSFLPAIDPTQALSVCVLGSKLARELFVNANPLGQWVRVGSSRFRVIGVLAEAGVSIGVDLADIVFIPVASAQALFNTSSLFRIMIEVQDRDQLPAAKKAVQETIRVRHDGEDDVTVIAQDAVLATFDRIFLTLTLAVGGIAAISLLVAGILIMNVMLVAVSQRTAEIGLLKALGAPPRQIMLLFLVESVILALIGAVLGVAAGFGSNWLLAQAYPDFPLQVPVWALADALGVAISAGILCGIMPARRAARLDPVVALSRR